MNPIIYQRRTNSTEDSMLSVPSLDDRMHSIDSRFGALATPQDASRTSINTYRTTVSYIDEYDEDDYFDSAPVQYKSAPSRVVPATPTQFADIFPHTKSFSIKHDDSSPDSDMNLRVDAGHTTLFHARMYDLRDRDISIRRYGRDCGREVAHTKRRYLPQRPTLTKALSSFGRRDADIKKLTRSDSGYSSETDDEGELSSRPGSRASSRPGTPIPKPSNTCTLEFSNYAHVELTRRGTKPHKKYDFEYWGTQYSWRRYGDDQCRYELTNNTNNSVIAHINPVELTEEESADDDARGCFVPPCVLTLDRVCHDRPDVADVIVSTALLALIDDNIKRKYHRKRVVQLSLPGAGKALNMEYVGPRRFLDEMISRRPGLPRSVSTSARLKSLHTW